MSEISTVVLDFDDTTSLTGCLAFDLENTVLERMGRPHVPRKVHLATMGQHLFDVITVRSPGIDVNTFKEAYYPTLAKFISEGRLDVIPEENYETIDRLRGIDKRVMILTSRSLGEFQHILAPEHALSTRIEAFYYREKMKLQKPDPGVFDELLTAHLLQPASCVYVGDSPTDGLAANGAGMRFIASLEAGFRTVADFDGLRVDAYINRFTELPAAIAAIENS